MLTFLFRFGKLMKSFQKISQQHRLMPGDIIMTGTPAGVGAVVQGMFWIVLQMG